MGDHETSTKSSPFPAAPVRCLEQKSRENRVPKGSTAAPLPTFDGWRGRTAELGEFLPQHGAQLFVQLGVVEERGQVSVSGREKG